MYFRSRRPLNRPKQSHSCAHLPPPQPDKCCSFAQSGGGGVTCFLNFFRAHLQLFYQRFSLLRRSLTRPNLAPPKGTFRLQTLTQNRYKSEASLCDEFWPSKATTANHPPDLSVKPRNPPGTGARAFACASCCPGRNADAAANVLMILATLQTRQN